MGYYDNLIFINAKEVKNFLESNLSTSHGEFYGLNFISKGKMCLSSDGKEYLLTAPCVFWHTPKPCIFRSIPNMPRDQIWTNFLGERGERMVAELSRQNPEPFTAIYQPDKYYELFRELSRLFSMRTPGNHYQMVILLERLIGKTIDEIRRSRSDSNKFSEIENLGIAIQEAPLQEWNFHRESKRLGISHSGFREKFRSFHGLPPYEFLLKCRMLHAASLLMENKSNIKEIAFKCHFDDVSSFSRLFKKKMGMPPNACKNIIHKSR